MKIVVIHIWAQWTLAVVIARFFCGRQKVNAVLQRNPDCVLLKEIFQKHFHCTKWKPIFKI